MMHWALHKKPCGGIEGLLGYNTGSFKKDLVRVERSRLGHSECYIHLKFLVEALGMALDVLD